MDRLFIAFAGAATALLMQDIIDVMVMHARRRHAQQRMVIATVCGIPITADAEQYRQSIEEELAEMRKVDAHEDAPISAPNSTSVSPSNGNISSSSDSNHAEDEDDCVDLSHVSGFETE